MKEIWRDIVGYEGLYQVSNKGRVYSSYYNKILRCEKLKKIGLRVCLIKNKKRSKKLVHRLVAEAFIPNPENKPQVNHIDGNRLNNLVNNLEWCTQSENIQHADRNNLRNMMVSNGGCENKKSIFKSKDDIINILNLSLIKSNKQIAKIYNTKTRNIRRITTGETYRIIYNEHQGINS